MSHIPASGVLRALGVTTAATLVLPANAAIMRIVVFNNTANAITGGLKFGTTAGGADVAAALAVGASAAIHMTDAALLKSFFSTSATQTIYIDAVTLWNSANVDIKLAYGIM